jgi:glycosyltransferase involved in cell wall biosynthesis
MLDLTEGSMKLTNWHIITGEYPPQVGGVSDYTKLVAAGLAAEGDEVHVWCTTSNGLTPQAEGVVVHRELNRLTPFDLRRTGRMLGEFSRPRRLLVQWVPHGFGYKAMNLPFCLWLWSRAKLHGDTVEIMVHEPYLPFRGGSWKQSAVALVHRLMTVVILNAASRVWLSIPAWEKRLLPYTLGKRSQFIWLPVPSNVPVIRDPSGVRALRNGYAKNGTLLVGHFGTGGRHIESLLRDAISCLWQTHPDLRLLLLGRGSESLREVIANQHPELKAKIHATGWLPAEILSLHISACDLMLQPYPDGVSSRRSSIMIGLSHGIPVVTTTGQLTEPLWDESCAVLLAPVERVCHLAALARQLLRDSKERKSMGERAEHLYQERFDIQNTIRALRAT